MILDYPDFRGPMAQRYLDRIETPLFSSIAAVHTMEYKGKIDEHALTEAYRKLCLQFPIVGAEIARDSTGLLFRSADSIALDFSVINGTLDDLLKYDRESNRYSNPELEIGEACKVSNLLLVKGHTQGYISLAINHAATGGGSGGFYLKELLKLYEDISDGNRGLNKNSKPLPQPPTALMEDLLPADADASKWITGADYIARAPGELGICHAVTLDRMKTANLIQVAKSLKLGVNALLVGELASCLNTFESNLNGTPLNIILPVRLHDRVSPPVHLSDTTYFVAPITVSIHSNLEPLDIGIEFKRQSLKAIADRNWTWSSYTTDGIDIFWNGGARVNSSSISKHLKIVDWFINGQKAQEVASSNGDFVPGIERPKVVAAAFTWNDEMRLVFNTLAKRRPVIRAFEKRLDLLTANEVGR